MARNKGAGIYFLLMMAIVAAGVLIGSVYAVGMKKEASDEVYKYLCEFFDGGMRSSADIFVSSLADNIKIFFIIFAAGFFRLGTVFTMSAGCMEGFVSGFTTASLIKLMGLKGFLINLSSGLSAIVFMLNLIFFGACSMRFAVRGGKRERGMKKKYLFLSAAALTIFCIASVFDGYITTIFMKMIVNKM